MLVLARGAAAYEFTSKAELYGAALGWVTNPSGTHGIPAGRYVCDQMPVGGGSFQECE